MIPKLLHFVWVGGDLPAYASENIERFARLNPAHRVMIHGRDTLLPALEGLAGEDIAPDRLSDLIRLSALAMHGGWYWDCDFVPLAPLDQIERTFGLDRDLSGRLFAARQRFQANGALTVSNGVLACEDYSSALVRLIGELVENGPQDQRVAYGPQAVTDAAGRRPQDFLLGGAPCFFPFARDDARLWWQAVRLGRRVPPAADALGQVPVAIHLWAGGQAIDVPSTKPDGVHRGLVIAPWQKSLGDPTRPYSAAIRGLEELGYQVEPVLCAPGAEMPRPPRYIPDVAVCWNGRRPPIREFTAQLEAAGTTVLRMEHGFFDRTNNFQIDPRGILHWASWADDLADRVRMADCDEACALENLASDWPFDLKRVTARKAGYVLALGQVPGDTQLEASEIQHGKWLERLMAEYCLPRQIPCRFRPHPKAQAAYQRRQKWIPRCDGTLDQAVAGARFCVTINSNAGNEALAMGCPVLAVGPSLYGMAGVAIDSGVAGFSEAMDRMMGGWAPPPEQALRYLGLLARHQYSLAEIASGEAFVAAAPHLDRQAEALIDGR